MPRFSRIRLRALADLARQLRFAPAKAVRRQVAAVLRFAEQIDPARAYAEDEVVRRITGYRADTDSPAELAGGALLADLSAFAERLTNQARLTPADIEGGVLPLDALRRRWGVGARTIERYRRRGLIGVRVRDGARGVRLVFPESSVRWYEGRHAVMLARARARGMRRTSRDAPRVRGEGRPRLPAGARRTTLDEWRGGAGASELARRLNRTRASIHRIIHEERTRLLRSLDLSGPIAPGFADADAADRYLADTCVREGLGGAVERDVRALSAAARAGRAPDPRIERTRASAYHYLLYRVSRLITAERPGGIILDEAETLLRWAALLKVELVRASTGLIVRTIEERAGCTLAEMPTAEARRWCREAFEASASAVDRFDPFKGGRLAAPISLALARALANLPIPREAGARRAAPVAALIEDWSRRVAPWQAWLDAPPGVRETVEAGLFDERAARCLRARFGWSGGPPMTLRELRRSLGVSPGQLWRWLRTVRDATRPR